MKHRSPGTGWKATVLRRRALTRLPIVVPLAALFLVLLALGAGIQLWLDHDAYLEVAESIAENTTSILEEYAGQTFERIDNTLLDIRRQDFWNPRGGRQGNTNSRLTLLATTDLAIRKLLLVDAQGHAFAQSFSGNDSIEESFADSEAFRALKDRGDDRPYISIPVKDHGGEWHYRISRRLVVRGNRFSGIAVAEVEPAYFERLFRATGLGNRAVISLLRRDGVLLVRMPYREDLVGRNALHVGPRRQFLPIPTVGTASVDAVVNGVERIGYYRALDAIPLIVNVALPVNEVLRPWWHRVQETVTIYLAVAAAVALLAFLLARQGASLRQAEANARITERRLQAITANIPGVVFERVMRPNGSTYYTFVSAAAWDVLGLAPAEMQADHQRLRDIIVHEDRERVAQSRIESARDLSQWSQEFRVTVRRQVRWLRVLARPQRLENGEIIWDGVYTDITREKATAEELRQAQKMEAIGQLTGGIAHDFNNLLMVVQGNLQLLREGVETLPELASLADAATNAASRGAALTQRLLAFSRRQTLQPVITDVNQLALEMAELLRPTLGERIVIETQLAPDLWPTLVDRGQLENAVVNLAVNARDAMPQGGQVTISTANAPLPPRAAASTGAPGYVKISVRDTGIGMTDDVMRRAFDPFFTTKGPGKGSGLGLSMVYGFVTQSNGHVEIETEVNQGTTVHLYLPRDRGIPDKNEPQEALPVTNLGRGRQILIVEDDAEVRQLSVLMIRRLGFDTLEAAEGNSALQMLARSPEVALLFTDVVLPGGISGPDLAVQALQRRPGLAVLFTSGYAHTGAGSPGLPAQAVLLSKPYGFDALAKKLKQVLDAAQA